MPKMKTHRGAKKRFKVSKSGKVKFKRNNLRHILTSKNSKRKRQLRTTGILSEADTDRVLAMLPYE